MDTRQVSAGAGAWIYYLSAGVVTVAGYYAAVLADAPAWVRVALYCAVSASAAVAVLVGCFRHRLPAPTRRPWLMLGLSQVVYATADIIFYVSHDIAGSTAFPAPADPLYLSHYPLVVVGLILLIRLRSPGRDLPSLIDAATLAVVAAMLSWLYLIAPQARAESPDLVKIVSVAYPVMDLAMFAVALRLILGSGRRPMSFFLLAGNLLLIFAADTVYVTQQLDGTYFAGNYLDAIWLAGNLALGGAALHPTMSRLTEPTFAKDVRLSPVRLAALASAALIAPATLLVRYVAGALSDIPVIAGACAALFLLTVARLAGLVADQRRLAITDVLTGLRTRRYFEARLPAEINRARRTNSTVAVIIVDIDHFKSINDRYGHPIGDQVLIEVGNRLKAAVRDADLVARYGGEEFALVMPGIGPEELAGIGERLRDQVARQPFAVTRGRLLTATVSVGTACYPRHGSAQADLVTTADRALYAAKFAGRDRVVVGDLTNVGEESGQHLLPLREMPAYLQHIADEVDGWLSNREHGRAVGRWAALVAAALGCDQQTVHRADLAGRLHDIGKICIPREIWSKPGKLSEVEWTLVRQHPDFGHRLICVVPGMADIADIVRQHHERFDGAGYPNGLAGTEIRIEARIITVCDSWAAMLADRPYHTALSPAEGLAELVRGKESQFDPEVVDSFADLYAADALGTLRGLRQPDAPGLERVRG